MNNSLSKLILAAVVLSLAIFSTGCSQKAFVGFDHQSHFDYPNSNVLPVARVGGEATRSFFLSAPLITADIQEEAIMNALSKQADANILVNFMEFADITTLPFITVLKYRVEGVACKMEIGIDGEN